MLLVVATIGGLLVAGLLAPIRCTAPISRPPFRGCRRRVVGVLGICRDHGSRPGLRIIHLLGGTRLLSRRVCDRCGQSRVFLRMRSDGAPYLGCVGYPSCRNARMLKDYRF